MAESKAFNLLEGVTCEMVGEAVTSFLRDQKKMVVQNAKTTAGYIIQAKEESDGWKQLSGTAAATNVQILDAGNVITVEIGAGKWSDKIGAGMLGYFVFAPLAVTAVVGAVKQKKLPNEIFEFIEKFILSGGKTAVFGMGVMKTLDENQIECPKCKTVNTGTKFCKECGSRLGNECPNCHASVDFGTKFCPECGTTMMSGTTKCYNCSAEIGPDQKFCPECGAKVNQ